MARGFWRKKSRKGAFWYTRIVLADGRTVCRSTGCTDLEAAKRAKRWLEREAMAEADPAAHEAAACPLGEALIDFIDGRERAGKAEATLESYRRKSGHVVRLLGEGTDVNALGVADVEGYIDRRREEGASRHTVHKELVVLYGALRKAKRAGRLLRSVDELKVEFSAGYVPRKRWLTPADYARQEARFAAGRARCLRFIVLTGASWGEAARCWPPAAGASTCPGAG